MKNWENIQKNLELLLILFYLILFNIGGDNPTNLYFHKIIFMPKTLLNICAIIIQIQIKKSFNRSSIEQNTVLMNNMNKGLIVLAISSIFLAAYSFFKLNQQRKNKALPKQQKSAKKISKRQQNKHRQPDQSEALENNSQNQDSNDRHEQEEDRSLYDNDIKQQHPYEIILKKPVHNPDIDHIYYNILFNLNKSKGYEGVVKIKIISSKSSLNSKNLYLDTIASTILYLSVNSKKIDKKEIIFRNHQILIKKQWLGKNQNHIQIIFANKYAFMGDGLTCYFPLDQFNKYSVKGQVIYVRNGFYKVARIFPCLNLLNSCQVSLEVLHPNGFNVESNNHKTEMKIATKKQYPLYQFLFFANNKALNNSYRLNSSIMTQSNSFRSNDEIVKAKSQFAVAKLNTIHDFFMFCSAIVQIRPTTNLFSSSISLSSSSELVLKDILIRYFTKQHLVKKASSFINVLESQIVEILIKIDQYKRTHKTNLKYQCKIDIFFIDDVKAEGDFYSGSILLNENTIQRGIIDRRLYFLLCRAFVGMGLLTKKNDGLLAIEGYLKLNELTLQIFGECSDYIYVKNKQYEGIRNQCMRVLKLKENNQKNKRIFLTQEEQKQIDMEYWISQYYEKECRYFVKNLERIYGSVSLNVKNILQMLEKLSNEDYWAFFNSRYPFIQFNVSEVLIKISLIYKGVPRGQSQLKYAKDNFIKSKYYLKFFTYLEIQNQLKKFIELQSFGVEQILPFIKIKQSHLSSISVNLQGYLNIKQNKVDTKKLYEQFKKYNENNNFHHISALRRQIKRVKLMNSANIQDIRKNLDCGLMGWKLLQKLQISPQNQENYQLITHLQRIKCKKQIVRRVEPVLTAKQQTQKLLKDNNMEN